MIKTRYAVVCVALGAALLINLAAIYVRTSAQGTQNRAGLIVQFKDGRVQTRCVTFSEAEISGYDLLRRANMQVVADIAGGGTICKIGDTGCSFPAQQCFCDCQDLNQTCVYWIYYYQANGVWKYSPVGAETQKVMNGAMNAWIYGAGNASSSALAPPSLSFDQVCGDSAAQPAATDRPTPSPIPTNNPTKSLDITSTLIAIARATTLTPTQTAAGNAVAMAAATATTIPSITPTAPLKATATPEPASTYTPTTQPIASPSSEAPPRAPTPDSPTPGTANAGGYVIFGGIMLGLFVVLLITRRNTGKAKP